MQTTKRALTGLGYERGDMSRPFPDLPGWLFDIDEVSAGVYRIVVFDKLERSFSATGANAEELIRAARQRLVGAHRFEQALHRVRDAERAVLQELAPGLRSNPVTGTVLQLEWIRQGLLAMERELMAPNLPPRVPRRHGMGRMICDSWPLDSSLGALVIAAEQAYDDCWKLNQP